MFLCRGNLPLVLVTLGLAILTCFMFLTSLTHGFMSPMDLQTRWFADLLTQSPLDLMTLDLYFLCITYCIVNLIKFFLKVLKTPWRIISCISLTNPSGHFDQRLVLLWERCRITFVNPFQLDFWFADMRPFRRGLADMRNRWSADSLEP